MKPFVLTRQALADLRDIARYTDLRWGRERRNLYLKQLDDAFQLLARSPALGSACDDILPGYRKFPQGSHLVFYKAGTESVIEIIRVLHQSRDVESQMRDG